MTTTAPHPTPTATTPGAGEPLGTGELLGMIGVHHRRALAAEVEVFAGIAAYAEAHTTGALMPDPNGPLGVQDGGVVDAWVEAFGLPGADRMLDLAGPGAPVISEFAVIELAAALGRTTDSGRLLVGDVMEVYYRLPLLWQKVLDGVVSPWKARRIAQLTKPLSADAAAFVDRQVAHLAHKTGHPTWTKIINEAIARHEPETAEADDADAAADRHVHIALADLAISVGAARNVEVTALIDRADAEDLEAAIADLAAQLAQHQTQAGGFAEDLQVRRAKALGILARGEITLAFEPSQDTSAVEEVAQQPSRDPDSRTTSRTVVARTAKRRQVVLYVHLSAAALTSHGTYPGEPVIDPATGGLGIHLARLENHRTGPVTADAVREWCGTPDTQITVKPVIDLAETLAVDAYEIPDRIAERVRLRRSTCAFPHCRRPAVGDAEHPHADLDHLTPYDPNGPPGQTSTDNLVPQCRRDHRAKTHPSPDGHPWRVRTLRPGTWLWTSPHGQQYLVDPEGTTQL